MDREATIFVAGAGAFVGDAFVRRLSQLGFANVVGVGCPQDLSDAAVLEAFFAAARPSHVFLVAGRSGGISANQRYPADLMLDNLQAQTNVMRTAHRFGVRKLLFLASACVYPRECPQPMRPEQILDGPLEPTSEAYAVAKLAGIVLCHAYARQHGACFVAAIPANLFGPGDDLDPEDAHVVAGLMRRLHEARECGSEEVVVWGSGRARRDFLFIDDLVDACVFLMHRYDGPEPINVSGGVDVSIADLAERMRRVIGFEGKLVFDAQRPDGAPLKVLDPEPLRRLGWSPRTPLDEALATTYRWFVDRGAGAPGDA